MQERKGIIVKLSVLCASALNNVEWIYAETNNRKANKNAKGMF